MQRQSQSSSKQAAAVVADDDDEYVSFRLVSDLQSGGINVS